MYGSYEKEYTSTGKFHYLTVPLMLSCKILESGNSKLWLGGGMNYGLFLTGIERTKTTESLPFYPGATPTILYEDQSSEKIVGVYTNASFFKDPDGNYIELLDVMVRMQLRHMWKEKFITGLFYEYNPGGLYMKIYDKVRSNLRQPAIGIFLGIQWH